MMGAMREERGMLEMGVATQRWCALSRSISQSPSDDDDYECEHKGRRRRLDIMGTDAFFLVLMHPTDRFSIANDAINQ